eukprot:112494_1
MDPISKKHLPATVHSFDPKKTPSSESKHIPPISEHQKLVSYSLRIAKYWFLLTIPATMANVMITYIFVLYAESLGQHNHTIIAFVVYARYFLTGISTMFWSSISDKYRYDTMVTIIAILKTTGYAIQALAPNFTILVIGTMIRSSSGTILGIVLAFIAKYLPNNYAIKYTSILYAVAASSYLTGPLITGTIVELFSYRTVFDISTAISALIMIYAFFFITGSQKPLEKKQIMMKPLYIALKNDSSQKSNALLLEKNQFPVCVDKYGMIPTHKKNKKNDDPLLVVNELDNEQTDQSNSHSVSYSTWFLMFNITTANACLLGTEGIMATYYLVYCNEQFNQRIIYSTVQVSMFVLLFVGCSILTPPLLKRCYGKNALTKKSYKYEYIILFVGHFINIPLWFYVCQRLEPNHIFRWIIIPLGGIGTGFTNMTQEVMLLDFQPKQYAGKVSGAKIMSRQFAKAIGVLCVGILWQHNLNWFLWVIGCFWSISLLLTVIIFITHKCNKSYD